MTCPECGTALGPNARFCHICGREAGAKTAELKRPAYPNWKRWSVAVTMGCAAVLMLWLLLVPRADPDTSLIAGQPAPNFDLQAADGSRVRLADLKGKPMVLNFWATWCTPCRKEMPDFQAVYDKYHTQGLEIYGINVGESKVAVMDFRNRVGVNFPTLLDSEDKAQTAYKILPLPATFFVDRDGVIRGVYQYQMSRAQMEAEVQRLIAR